MDTNNLSVTLWHSDAQDFGAPELHLGSKGIAFNANHLVADDLMIFSRGGWSEGWVIARKVTVGLGWRPRRAPSYLIGFGFGWGGAL
jgi:porin